MTAATALIDRLAKLLRGEDVPFRAFATEPDRFLDVCVENDVCGLVHECVCNHGADDWPLDVIEMLAREARADATREMLRRREIASVLGALAEQGISPILFKGTALAYSVYRTPSTRLRTDTDLLVTRDQVDALRAAMTAIGYTAPVYCDGDLLFCQFELTRLDSFGVCHTLDVHWKISTQAVFADLLSFDELARCALPVPGLGPRARAAGPVHALLLACLHPVMHHRNAERLIWANDIHQLASRLAATEFDQFADLAIAKGVAAICARQLALAVRLFDTKVPGEPMGRLSAARTPQRVLRYLRAGRRWHHELVSSVVALPRWRDRVVLLREVAFPSADYMFKIYGVASGITGRLLLPTLYIHRVLRGIRKASARQK